MNNNNAKFSFMVIIGIIMYLNIYGRTFLNSTATGK